MKWTRLSAARSLRPTIFAHGSFLPCSPRLNPPTSFLTRQRRRRDRQIFAASCMIHFCYSILVLFLAPSCPNRGEPVADLELASDVSATNPRASGQLTVVSLRCISPSASTFDNVLCDHAVKQEVLSDKQGQEAA